MINHESDATPEKQPADGDPIRPGTDEPGSPQDVGPAPRGILDRVRNMFTGARRPPLASMREVSKDRTRSLLLLIGGSVGAVLLFIGVFSTPPRPSLQEARSQAGPNLGRPAVASARAPEQQGSVTPLLTADVRSTDLTRNQLNPSDISGTSAARLTTPKHGRHSGIDGASSAGFPISRRITTTRGCPCDVAIRRGRSVGTIPY